MDRNVEHRHLHQVESFAQGHPPLSLVDDWLVRGDLPEMLHLLRILKANREFRQAVRKMVASRLAHEDPEMEGRPKYVLVQTWLERLEERREASREAS